MHAMAPASRTEPHEGQTWPEDWLDCPAGNCKVMESLDPFDADPGAAALGSETVLTPAATASGTLAGTRNGLWQRGQRTFLPAALSGTCIGRWQWGQRIT